MSGKRSGRERARRILVDVTPLRLDRRYRFLWSGQAVNGIGTQITRIALPFQVYVMTGSTLAVAVLAAVQLVPILIFALGAGSLADAVDRRRVLIVTQSGQAATSLALLALALMPAPNLVAILAVAFVASSLSAIDQPTRSSAVPRLVAPERLPAAIALNELNFQTASVVGPAIGGLILATIGVAGAYAVDAASFLASLAALAAIGPIAPLVDGSRPSLGAIREGLRFAARRRIVLSTFVIDLNAMIFGMPTALFPALALDVFRVGPAGVGFLAAAPAVGAVAGALLSGWVSRVRRVGRAVVIAVAIWGIAIARFGLSTFSFPLALGFLAVAGAADSISAVFRNIIVQFETPDALRGRVMSIHSMVVTSGPRVGDIEAASVASLVGTQASVVSGGVLCVIGVVVVARLFPELAAHVARVREAALRVTE
ncbi:MAG TPA: MFS transporter [Candidatus Limnocylindrales bacterium]|nr:MFS transporter [Candidatus Limnocylindrales bacterium]